MIIFSVMTHSIIQFFKGHTTKENDTQYDGIQCNYAQHKEIQCNDTKHNDTEQKCKECS